MVSRTFLNRLTKRSGQGGTRHSARTPSRSRLQLETLEDRSVPAALSVVMSGLDNPRGLAFGPDGGLYVAEAGRGGTGPSFEPRPGEVASYGPSGAISRLLNGQQERVATGLPSIAGAGGVAATGPHDISFTAQGDAYVTVGFGTNPMRRAELGSAGDGFAQLVHLSADGQWTNAFDMGAYEAAFNPGGGPIDSNPYGVLVEAESRVVLDAGGNALLRIANDGTVTKIAEFPSRDDGRATDSVPNSVAVGPDGVYYVGELTGAPFSVDAARVYRVVPGQAPEIAYSGFTAILDLDFGPDGSLYVLQHATGPGLSGNGALIRITPDGTRTTIASEGLVKPSSVLVADDGTIYVSNRGIFPGSGEVVRVNAPTVESIVVNDGAAQRSMVTSLTVTFDREVTLDAGAFELSRQGGNPGGFDVATSLQGGKTVAVLTFTGPGTLGGSLADGNYSLTIRGDKVRDTVGRALDGNGDGAPGGDRTVSFHRLFGDSDGDRDVDLKDLSKFLSTFGRSVSNAAYLDYFDANQDGFVGVIDLLAFVRRFGGRLKA